MKRPITLLAFALIVAGMTSQLQAEQKRLESIERLKVLLNRGVQDETKAEMRQILREIQNGEFAREFIQENQSGQITLQAKRRIGREHPIEEVGERLRGMMPWIQKIVDKSKN